MLNWDILTYTPKAESCVEFIFPKNCKIKPFLGWLKSNKKAALFFEVGSGKTFTALSTVCDLPSGNLLIVAPKKVLKDVWLKDTNYDLTKHNVTYLNYEKIARDKNFTKHKWDYIILDEVHKLKGKSTKTSRKFMAVCKKAEYVIGLTGTPMANSYLDIYNIYKHMDIREFTESYNEFVEKYYYTKDMSNKFGFPFMLPLAVKDYKLDELLSRIGKHCLVKRTRDCIDLPDERTEIIYIKGMCTAKYKEIVSGILKTPDYEKTMIKLEAINKAHQASNGFYYDAWGTVHEFQKNNKYTELLDYLDNTLEETERVIIVYYYKKDLQDLQKLPYKWTLEPSEFPNNQILFLQFGQAEGLNLQYSHVTIFYTYDYSFLKYEQMCGRTLRDGQKHNVTFVVMIAENTIEEKIWRAISKKQTNDEFFKEAFSDD